MQTPNIFDLTGQQNIHVRQRRELWELVGMETRNKYEFVTDSGQPIAFAAEQQKGIWGFLLRHFLGHWRRFDILFFSTDRKMILRCRHPFRFFFQRFEVFDSQDQLLGAIQQRFGLITKKFDIEDSRGNRLLTMRSGFFRIWTFPIKQNGKEVARIEKKWSGLLTEIFLDKDKFTVSFQSPNLSLLERHLILASSVFVDLQYFEKKAG